MKVLKVILPYIISLIICNLLYVVVGLKIVEIKIAIPIFFSVYLVLGLYWIGIEKSIWTNIGIPFWFFIVLLIFGLVRNISAVKFLLMPLIIPTLLGLFCAFFIKRYNKIIGGAAILLSSVVIIFYGFYLIPKQNYSIHVLENQNKVNLSILKSDTIKFQDLGGKSIGLKDLNKKIVYAEFWFTTCRPCLDKMPIILKLKEKYKNNNDVIFISIVDGEIDNFQDFQKISSEYSKPFDLVLYAPKETSVFIKKIMNFNMFPYEALFFNEYLYSSHIGFNKEESSYYLSQRKETIDQLLEL